MKIATLLLKVMAKSVCHCASMDSSLFLCGLLLKSLMEQLQVGVHIRKCIGLIFCAYNVDIPHQAI